MSVRNQLITLGCVLFLIGLADFAGRVYVGRDASLRAFEAPGAQRPLPVESVEDARRRLYGWLPVIAGTGATSQDPADPKTWSFTLIGVFAGKDKAVAVLMSSLQAGAPGEKVRVTEGDSVHGWRVVRVDHRSATLQHGTETRELTLFRHGSRQLPGSGSGPR